MKPKLIKTLLLFSFFAIISCSNPKNENDLQKTAIQAIEKGQWQKAAQLSEEWYQLMPNDAEANYQAATNYLRLNYPNKALSILNSFKKSNQIMADEVGKREARIAKAYYMTGQFSEVLEVVDNYNYPKMYRGLAREHLKALIQLEQFEQLSTQLDTYRESGIYRENGKTTDTDFLFRAVLNELALMKNDTLIVSYVKRFQDWISKNQNGSDSLKNSSFNAYYLQNYELASKTLLESKKEDFSPRHLIEIEMLHGLCYAKMGKFEKADLQIEKIQSMPALPPRHDAFGAKWYNQARIEVAMGKKEEALQSLNKALDNNATFWSYKFKEDSFLMPLFGYEAFEEMVKVKD